MTTVNRYAVAGGVGLIGAAVVGAAYVHCRQDFAEAIADGDFDRAERRAGLLAINEIAPAALQTLTMGAMALCAAWLLLTTY